MKNNNIHSEINIFVFSSLIKEYLGIEENIENIEIHDINDIGDHVSCQYYISHGSVIYEIFIPKKCIEKEKRKFKLNKIINEN